MDLFKCNRSLNYYLIKLANLGLSSLINQHTRLTAEKISRIVHSFIRHSNRHKLVCENRVIDAGASDHKITAVRIESRWDKCTALYIQLETLEYSIICFKSQTGYSMQFVSFEFEMFLIELNNFISSATIVESREKNTN